MARIADGQWKPGRDKLPPDLRGPQRRAGHGSEQLGV